MVLPHVLLCASIIRLIYDKYFDQTNVILTDAEQAKIREELNNLYEKSSLNKQPDTKPESKELLAQIRDFYSNEMNMFSNDYNEFLQKTTNVIGMFTAPLPVYLVVIPYVTKNSKAPIWAFVLLIIAISIYVLLYFKVVRIQSFLKGFTKIQLELPFKIKDISVNNYLKIYILSAVVHLKIQRENLRRLKERIINIHTEYIISSLYLIAMIVILYFKK